MKKFLSILLIVVIFSSCVSMTDREMTEQEMANANIAGKVSTTFTTFRFLNFIGDKSIKNKAQKELLKKAQEKYGEYIVIRNIVIKGSGSLWNLAFSLGGFVIQFGEESLVNKDEVEMAARLGASALLIFGYGHFQKITATGDVILFGTDQEVIHKNQQGLDQGVIHKNQQGLEGAIIKAVETLTKSLPQNSNIAILNMEASDISTDII